MMVGEARKGRKRRQNASGICTDGSASAGRAYVQDRTLMSMGCTKWEARAIHCVCMLLSGWAIT